MTQKPKFETKKEEKEYLIGELKKVITINIGHIYPDFTGEYYNPVFTNLDDADPRLLVRYGFNDREVEILKDKTIEADNINHVDISSPDWMKGDDDISIFKSRREERRHLIRELIKRVPQLTPPGSISNENLDDMLVDFDPDFLVNMLGFNEREVEIILDNVRHSIKKFVGNDSGYSRTSLLAHGDFDGDTLSVIPLKKMTVDRDRLPFELHQKVDESPIVFIALNNGLYYLLKSRYEPEKAGKLLTDDMFHRFVTQAKGTVMTIPENQVKSIIKYEGGERECQ